MPRPERLALCKECPLSISGYTCASTDFDDHDHLKHMEEEGEFIDPFTQFTEFQYPEPMIERMELLIDECDPAGKWINTYSQSAKVPEKKI
jgi:hypothetical protein